MTISSYDPSKDQEFLDFIKELEKESDRGIAIICHAYVEDKLKELLKKRLIDDMQFIGRLKRLSFADVIILCYITGIITKQEKKDIECLSEVRNKFAHSRRINDFERPEISKLCDNLRIPDFLREKKTTRQKYIVSAGYYIQILNWKLRYVPKVKTIEEESKGLTTLDHLYV